MKFGKLFAAALVMGLAAGIANAKIPAPVMDDAAKAKAEEAKAKAADAAKKEAELLAKSQDRTVERYKKSQGKPRLRPRVPSRPPRNKRKRNPLQGAVAPFLFVRICSGGKHVQAEIQRQPPERQRVQGRGPARFLRVPRSRRQSGDRRPGVAHVIRARPGGEFVARSHWHETEFQLVYILKGWIKFDYEGVGEVLLEAGSCAYQPPGIRHRELGHSDDIELLEVCCRRFQNRRIAGSLRFWNSLHQQHFHGRRSFSCLDRQLVFGRVVEGFGLLHRFEFHQRQPLRFQSPSMAS